MLIICLNSYNMAIMRLDKLLSDSGCGSRSTVKDLLKKGQVMVDGEVVKQSETKIDTEKNQIILNGRIIKYKKYIYLMLNKPSGIISATEDKIYFKKTVIDLLDENLKKYKPFPVGRLDRDTVGLLLITNDGKFSHNTLSPKKHVQKIYYADIYGVVTDADVQIFKKGVVLRDGYKCKSATLNIIHSDFKSKVTIEISEGKFHQVKKMFEAVDKEVFYLKRIEFAGIKLDENLEEGHYRELNENELNLVSEFMDKN